MSLQFRDTLSAGLARRLRALSNRRPVLDAIGAELVSLTQRAFSDPASRPSPWAPRKTVRHPHPLLRESGALYGSIRVLQTTNGAVSAGSDLPYAAVHQFGSARQTGRGGGIPARPFFPYAAAGNMTPLARTRIKSAAALALRQLLAV